MKKLHIEAAKKGGERFNEFSNDEDRRSFENLILMCSNHHKRTNNTDIYTATKLNEMKSQHEKGSIGQSYVASKKIINQAIQKLMEQENNNSGTGTQFNNQAKNQNIGTQIGTQTVNDYKQPSITAFIDGA